MSRYDFVPVDCVVLKTTNAAILIGTDLGDIWIPKSLCEGSDDIDEGDEEVRIQRWKVEEVGLS